MSLEKIKNLHYEGKLLEARAMAKDHLDQEEVCFEYCLICLDLHISTEAENQVNRLEETHQKLIKTGIDIERKRWSTAKECLQQLQLSGYENWIKQRLLFKVLKAMNAPYGDMAIVAESLSKGDYESEDYAFQYVDFLLKDHQYDLAKKQFRKLALKYPSNEALNEYRRRIQQKGNKAIASSVETSLEDPLEELEKFIGLEPVKATVKQMVKTIQFNEQRKVLLNIDGDSGVGSHFIFKGNPGTGKTTIARILGHIFQKYGILEKGHVVEVDRSGLVGEFIGQTEKKTQEAIEEAKGGILFVDEAYALYRPDSDNDFGKEAIDTLLKAMEDLRGQVSIIFAGYNDEMEAFTKSNPGLRSRIDFHLHFPDYKDEELLEIAQRIAEEKHYRIHESSQAVLHELIEIERVDESFGNARVVRNHIESAIRTKATRLAGTSFSKEEAEFLMPIDFGYTDFSSKEAIMNRALDELNTMVGLDSLKKEILDIKDFAAYQLKRKALNLSNQNISYHMIFEGNPGTGKTSVARILAQIFKSLGILKRGHLVEASREDLVAPYVGQTAEKTARLIRKAYGGVLFVDEAYSLAGNQENDFGREAIDTLIKHMEDDRDRVIIILAGYTHEMQNLLNQNSGFESRINYKLHFNDYSESELKQLMDLYIDAAGYTLAEGADEAKECLIEKLSDIRGENFGNGRSVRNIFEKVKVNQGTRFNRDNLADDQIAVIEAIDFMEVL